MAALLREAGETHHTIYRIVDGDDPDWASWYADWLVRRSELPSVLKTTPVRSELIYELVKLAREFKHSTATEPWERFTPDSLCSTFRLARTNRSHRGEPRRD